MTEQVRVAPGGAIPPVPAGATVTEHSREGIPPQNMQPGFVPPQPAPQQQPQQPQQPAAAPTVDPTIAALLAALSGQPAAQPGAAPAPATPAPAPTGGDPLVQGLSGLLSGAGLDLSRALAHAKEYGDANLIDREYIKATAGANAPYLIQVAEQIVAYEVREEQAAVSSAHQLAGSEANWNSAVAVFNQSAPPHLVQICKVMADSGNRAQTDAAAKMVVEFAKGNGGLVQPANLLAGQAHQQGATALSKEQFQAELQKLDRNSRDYEQQRQELFGRRGMGKQLGR